MIVFEGRKRNHSCIALNGQTLLVQDSDLRFGVVVDATMHQRGVARAHHKLGSALTPGTKPSVSESFSGRKLLLLSGELRRPLFEHNNLADAQLAKALQRGDDGSAFDVKDEHFPRFGAADDEVASQRVRAGQDAGLLRCRQVGSDRAVERRCVRVELHEVDLAGAVERQVVLVGVAPLNVLRSRTEEDAASRRIGVAEFGKKRSQHCVQNDTAVREIHDDEKARSVEGSDHGIVWGKGERNDRCLMLAQSPADLNCRLQVVLVAAVAIAAAVVAHVVLPDANVGVRSFFARCQPAAGLRFCNGVDCVVVAADERLVVGVGCVRDDDRGSVGEGKEVLGFFGSVGGEREDSGGRVCC